MKWVRLRNKGSLDLPKMLNLLGASVKFCDEPIGEFGNGSRYAMALAARLEISLKICSDGETYTMLTKPETFRGKEFQVVCFRTKTGKVIRSPITTELGQSDWVDKFYIFREFYSNLLDEGGEVHLTDGYEDYQDGFIDVYLPYNEFKEYVDNLDKYFNSKPSGTLAEGTGKVYKKGVYVGTIPDMKIDMWDNKVKITESRTMLQDSAINCLSDNMSDCQDSNIFRCFFESKKAADCSLYLYESKTEVVDKALKSIYGENYCICPKVDSIISGCIGDGFVPVLLSENWSMSSLKLPNYLSKLKNVGTRALNSAEQVLIDKITKSIEFITGGVPLNIVVIDNPELARFGDCNKETGLIRLHPKNFENYMELMDTIIHEVGHLITKASDWDSKFVRFFTMKLAELCK